MATDSSEERTTGSEPHLLCYGVGSTALCHDQIRIGEDPQPMWLLFWTALTIRRKREAPNISGGVLSLISGSFDTHCLE